MGQFTEPILGSCFRTLVSLEVNFALVHLAHFVCVEYMFQETSACGLPLKREPSFSGLLGYVRYFFAIHV